jgi:hypothetical protein
MPAIARRLLIWAAVDGLVLQAQGSAEHQKTIQVDYTHRQIKELSTTEDKSKKATPLEAHGIIGRARCCVLPF